MSDLYGAQQGHADLWQICLAHQLRDCQYAIDAGDAVFAPRMKMLLLRAAVLARRRKRLAESTRRTYQRRLDHALNAIMMLAPVNSHGKRLRKRYGKVRNSLFTFLEHPEAPPDNNGSERELRPTATYRKVTGGFRSNWGADLFAAVRSVVGTAARRGTRRVSGDSRCPGGGIYRSTGLSRYGSAAGPGGDRDNAGRAGKRRARAAERNGVEQQPRGADYRRRDAGEVRRG